MYEKFQELAEVIDRLNAVNKEIDRMQSRIIEDLKKKVDMLESNETKNELVLEKVVYKMTVRRSNDS
jgi:DNA-binding FrmR family transcriptional regulator